MILGPWLAANPEKVVTTRTDEEAMLLIRELDLEKDFPPESKTRSYSFGYALHHTHWIVAGVWRGIDHPDNNMHYVICYPKRHYTMEQVREFITAALAGKNPQPMIPSIKPK